jgi:hypothetical protein
MIATTATQFLLLFACLSGDRERYPKLKHSSMGGSPTESTLSCTRDFADAPRQFKKCVEACFHHSRTGRKAAGDSLNQSQVGQVTLPALEDIGHSGTAELEVFPCRLLDDHRVLIGLFDCCLAHTRCIMEQVLWMLALIATLALRAT